MSSNLRNLVAVQEQILAAVANLSESSEGIGIHHKIQSALSNSPLVKRSIHCV